MYLSSLLFGFFHISLLFLLSPKHLIQAYNINFTYVCLGENSTCLKTDIYPYNPGYIIIINCTEADAIISINNCNFYSVLSYKGFFDERYGKLTPGSLSHSSLYDQNPHLKEECALKSSGPSLAFIVPEIPFIDRCAAGLTMKNAANIELHVKYNETLFIALDDLVGSNALFFDGCNNIETCESSTNIELSEYMYGKRINLTYFIYDLGMNVYSNVGYLDIYICCENCDYDEN